MDSFTSTVTSQTFCLNQLDSVASIFTIPICYWYENSARVSWDSFMPAKILERAFYMVLQENPIFAGHLRADSSGRLYIDVNKNNLNMPGYTDTLCNLDFSVMSDSGFDIRKLPGNLGREYRVPAPSGLVGGELKSACFSIVRFKDNSGILVYATISHFLVDGYGFTHFMNRWAEISRWLQKPQDTDSAPLTESKLFFNRDIHTGYLSSQTTALDPSLVKDLSSRSSLARWLTWISPETRGRLFKAVLGTSNHTCCFFHISSETMKALRSSVQAYAPEGVCYSINDVITAYIVIVVAQAKEKAAADWWSKPLPSILSTVSGGAFGKPSDLVGIVYVNIRPRVSVENADRYLGTMSFGKSIVFPQSTLPKSPNNEAVSTLTLQIRKIISSMNEQYLGQYVHLVNSHPDNYMCQTIGLFKQRNKLMVSNHSRFEHYSVDFGAGTPTLVRHTPHAFSDLVYVMPANPTRGGYEVEFNLAPDVAINIICNNKWMKLADKFDSYL